MGESRPEQRSLKRSNWMRILKKFQSSARRRSTNGSGTNVVTQESLVSPDSTCSTRGGQIRSSTLNLELDPVQRISSSVETVKARGVTSSPKTPSVMDLFPNGWSNVTPNLIQKRRDHAKSSIFQRSG